MKFLAMDTSTKHFSLAVCVEGKVSHSRNIQLKGVLSSSIMPAINAILNKAGVFLGGLDGFAVGLGPGSFTSLRVGMSTVKGLAFATGKPVVGIPSLDVLAMSVADEGLVCALGDAKRNMVYACIYRKEGEALIKKSKYLLTDIKDVLKKIKGEAVFIGDGALLYRDAIEKSAGIKPRFADCERPFTIYPQAKYLAKLAHKRFEAKDYDAAESLVPLYLYPQDCQVSRKSS